MTTLTATSPSLKHTAISETVGAWLLDDYSTLAPGWFSWPADSGENSIAILLHPHNGINRVSVHEALDAQQEEHAKAEIAWRDVDRFVPRTPLGKKLWNLRQQILASSVPLLTWDEIEAEVRQRRGENN